MTIRKYNPGFLTDDELVASFCVRTGEFESIVNMLSECTGSAQSTPDCDRSTWQRKDEPAAARRGRSEPGMPNCDPAFFRSFSPRKATKSPLLASSGWNVCLAWPTRCPVGGMFPTCTERTNTWRTIQDDQILAELCLGALLDFSDREGKRLVLMVENLNMMFRDMADSEAGWRLRKILQTEAAYHPTSECDQPLRRDRQSGPRPCTTCSGYCCCTRSTPRNAPRCGKRCPANALRLRPFDHWRFSPVVARV